MKNEIECKYETQKIKKSSYEQIDCLENAENFFKKNIFLKTNEIFYVIKAFVEETQLFTEGRYLGANNNPLDALINWDGNSNEISLSAVTSIEELLHYLQNSKRSSKFENIYVFKILYKENRMHKIKSFHYDIHDIDLYLFDSSNKKNGNRGEVLKVFRDRDTLSAINFYVPVGDDFFTLPKN